MSCFVNCSRFVNSSRSAVIAYQSFKIPPVLVLLISVALLVDRYLVVRFNFLLADSSRFVGSMVGCAMDLSHS